jgi:hypothetical protein
MRTGLLQLQNWGELVDLEQEAKREWEERKEGEEALNGLKRGKEEAKQANEEGQKGDGSDGDETDALPGTIPGTIRLSEELYAQFNKHINALNLEEFPGDNNDAEGELRSTPKCLILSDMI